MSRAPELFQINGFVTHFKSYHFDTSAKEVFCLDIEALKVYELQDDYTSPELKSTFATSDHPHLLSAARMEITTINDEQVMILFNETSILFFKLSDPDFPKLHSLHSFWDKEELELY